MQSRYNVYYKYVVFSDDSLANYTTTELSMDVQDGRTSLVSGESNFQIDEPSSHSSTPGMTL